jgi:hypothetical protein
MNYFKYLIKMSSDLPFDEKLGNQYFNPLETLGHSDSNQVKRALKTHTNKLKILNKFFNNENINEKNDDSLFQHVK